MNAKLYSDMFLDKQQQDHSVNEFRKLGYAEKRGRVVWVCAR